jgi:hypothetical protein
MADPVADIVERRFESHQSIRSALSKHSKCVFSGRLLLTVRINVEWGNRVALGMVQSISFTNKIIKIRWWMQTRSILVGLMGKQLLDNRIWMVGHGSDESCKTLLFTVNVIVEDPELLKLLGIGLDVVVNTR